MSFLQILNGVVMLFSLSSDQTLERENDNEKAWILSFVYTYA